jgi:DNA-directed RNA polymerase subunit M/transcription elongation factor TFIIS
MKCPKCGVTMQAARINGRDVPVCSECGYRAVVAVQSLRAELARCFKGQTRHGMSSTIAA